MNSSGFSRIASLLRSKRSPRFFSQCESHSVSAVSLAAAVLLAAVACSSSTSARAIAIAISASEAPSWRIRLRAPSSMPDCTVPDSGVSSQPPSDSSASRRNSPSWRLRSVMTASMVVRSPLGAAAASASVAGAEPPGAGFGIGLSSAPRSIWTGPRSVPDTRSWSMCSVALPTKNVSRLTITNSRSGAM